MIGISLGDVTGIGPEVTLKALAAQLPANDSRYLIIGDTKLVRKLNARLGLNLELADYAPTHSSGRIQLLNPLPEALPDDLPPGSPLAARASLTWLTEGARRCLSGELEGLVTAPVNKESIIRLGEHFVGQTEYLSDLGNTDQAVMMLLGCDDRKRWLRVALVTTHLPLREVAANITREKIELAIERAAQACRDLGLERSKIGVCGLNPHAGEGGKMGDEESKIVRPAVEAARYQGLDVLGPFAADSLFYYAFRGDYDAVVAMYHDQGLAPLKMIGFESGVNWTLGLPFIRTSPDHGTAYDIANQGIASASSMQAAIALADKLSRRKQENH